MGATQSNSATTSVLQIPVEESLFPEGPGGFSLASAMETEAVLKRYGFGLEHNLPAGSGRMTQTFQLKRRGPVESTAIAKAAWILEQPLLSSDSSSTATSSNSGNQQQQQQPTLSWMEQRRMELMRIRNAVRNQPHVAPFHAWLVGDARPAPRNLLQLAMLHNNTSTATASRSTTNGPNHNNNYNNNNMIHTSSSSSNNISGPCQVRPVYLLRASVYTTLADRLASRPWLTTTEKLWITSQILQAVTALHASGVVHGFLTTENIGLTSTGWVLLLDLSSPYKGRTQLPDDDPSEYLYYFQPSHQNTTHPPAVSQPQQQPKTEKRCYLAPERFYTPGGDTTRRHSEHESPPLTPAMDIFSMGCVLTELFLNGERCLDLGDLMEYRRLNNSNNNNEKKNATTNAFTPVLQQRLQKIELSAVRAACRHMLAAHPQQRLSAAAYWERLQAAQQFPPSFVTLTNLCQRMMIHHNNNNNNEKNNNNNNRIWTPDARIALCAAEYGHVLWETMGVRDPVGEVYFAKILGPTVSGRSTDTVALPTKEEEEEEEEKKEGDGPLLLGSKERTEFLFAQVESLLKNLDSNQNVEDDADESMAMTTVPSSFHDGIGSEPEQVEERSFLCKSSLLIFLQIILSTIRHAQRPASKLVALQLVDRLSRYSTDETRLQRIVPVTVSLLQDPDPLVRASAVQVLTLTLSIIQAFPPSDSKVFPQYIFKRVAHMISDPSLVVRLAFARCIATLAEAAHRFLDISHAVRLYEAVGNGGTGSGTVSRDETCDGPKEVTVFGDEVAKLLDRDSRTSSRVSMATTEQTEGSVDSSKPSGEATSTVAGKLLINSTYNAELLSLHEMVSRWVVYVMTDQSEHSSLQKRCLLGDVGRLCAFFGLDGVMSFVLPQILAFLNERKDWELRAALFEHLPAVCQCIGRAATEEFILPCVEIGLVDGAERVVCCSLSCLARIVDLGLLSRSSIIGYVPKREAKSGSQSLLVKYGPLLLHPSEDVRHNAIEAFATICESIGPPDCDVYVIPLLRPFFRFHPPSNYLNSVSGMKRCLKSHWTRAEWNRNFKVAIASENNGLWTAGAWTSIGGIMLSDEQDNSVKNLSATTNSREESPVDPEKDRVQEYLRMLARHKAQSSVQDRSLVDKSSSGLLNGIEGSAKLAQSIMFPRQNGRFKNASLPTWYANLRDTAESTGSSVSEATAIRSVATLGHVYGLSIMGTTDIVGAADDSQGAENEGNNALSSSEAKTIQAAFDGEWGSEISIDPSCVDTCLLVTKLKALGVPPLSLKLGDPVYPSPVVRGSNVRDSSPSVGWRPSLRNLVATSSTTAHIGPVVRLAVSVDKNFFVSGSHDGTCRVWEVAKIDDSSGLLESSVTYSEHLENGPTRINDVAMLEGTHSIVSGDSSGSVHIWRVDMLMPGVKHTQSDQSKNADRPRAVGSTNMRKIDPFEGEVLAVSHFNSLSASVVTYASQKGVVHSWDLRSASEPFRLSQSPDLGHLSTMALGSDRNWILTGTSKGYLTLWDVRFQRCLKLWRHSRRAPISRLATSSVPPPQTWNAPSKATPSRPYIFVAAGSNECAMFDAINGTCNECFRIVVGDSRNLNAHTEEPPTLTEVAMSTKSCCGMLRPAVDECSAPYASPVSSINCMVGSIGASSHSYLITGGSDCRIRFWDFSTPSKCFVVSGQSQIQSRTSYERIDFEENRRLMLCRQSHNQGLREANRVPRKIFHGLSKPDNCHSDAIQDIKVIENTLVSCSRDCTVKVWR